jgi:type IV pilus assembly protein PilC
MPRYAYKALNESGKIVKGAAEYPDSSYLISYLAKNKLYPVEIADVSSVLYKNIGLKSINAYNLAVFCSQFEELLKCGLSITDSLNIMKKQFKDKKLKEAIGNTSIEVEKGKSLSCAMKSSMEYPPFLVSMIETGEAAGRLDEVMSIMAQYYKKNNELKQKIISSLIYPAVVLVISISVLVFYISNVLPLFINIFESFDAELPASTKVLISMGTYFKRYWYVAPLVFAALYYVLRKYCLGEKGRYSVAFFLLKTPLFGLLYSKIIASTFACNLSLLLKSGVPITKAMCTLHDTFKNVLLKKTVKDCEEELRQGGRLSDPIKRSGLFPEMMVEMICIGEETGNMDEMLYKLSEYYYEQLNVDTERLVGIIGPIITIILGIFICFILVSMIMPVFNMHGIY